MAAKIIETVDANVFDALKEGRLSFFTLPSVLVGQPGDTLVFRKKSSSGGYETEVGNHHKALEISFTLGFAIPGGTLGIEIGRTGFQLEKHE